MNEEDLTMFAPTFVEDRPPADPKAPVAYILASCGACGGVKVIFEHVAGLVSRGRRAQVWHLGPGPDWFDRPLPCRHFPGTNELGAAMRAHRGVLVATWWETAEWVASCHNGVSRQHYLVQDIETSYASGRAEGERVLATYHLGLTHVTEGDWVTERLRLMGVDAVNVGIGISHDTFRPLPMLRERNRVTLLWRTQGAGDDLKGMRYVPALVQAIRRRHPRAEFVTFGREPGPQLPPEVPHIHVQGGSDLKLRELYSQTGVFLFPSRHEGFGLPALEAMACGAAVACFDADGNTEFCCHGETALVAAQGDVEALARHAATLLGDHALADRLGAAGREVALEYQWDRVIDRLIGLYWSEQ